MNQNSTVVLVLLVLELFMFKFPSLSVAGHMAGFNIPKNVNINNNLTIGLTPYADDVTGSLKSAER